jgi:hypothetical protein
MKKGPGLYFFGYSFPMIFPLLELSHFSTTLQCRCDKNVYEVRKVSQLGVCSRT